VNKTVLLSYLNPRRAVLFFVASNFLFLVFDVLIAHSYNRFAKIEEWIPVGYSAFAGLFVLIYAVLENPPAWKRKLTHLVFYLGVLIGLAGFFYHFYGAIFHEFSLKSLVYAAPLAAPLAFAGLSLAGLFADCFISGWGEKRRSVLLLLVSSGFAGNLILSVLDHARNGFFVDTEWIPVFISAFAFIVFGWAGLKRKLSAEDRLTVHFAILLAIVTGIAGFVFHLAADLQGVMPDLRDRFIYGAPIFAPLLFCDIAFLGLLIILAGDDFQGWLPGLGDANKQRIEK